MQTDPPADSVSLPVMLLEHVNDVRVLANCPLVLSLQRNGISRHFRDKDEMKQCVD